MNLDIIIVDSLNVIKTKSSLTRSIEVAPRSHHSLSYRIAGENIIHSGNTRITSNAHTLTFVPMGVAYTHHVVTLSEQIVVHFTTKGHIGDTVENFALPRHCDIERLFYSLYHQWELEQKESNLQCMAIFYDILALIARNASNNAPKKHRFLDDSVVYMHAHYRESDFNIAKLYQQAYVSPAYYRRVFKEVYQCPPVEYLKRLRLNYAKQLLCNGYYTIAEIAELSGFSTPTYFSYEFKRTMGCAPSQYRR